MVPGVWAAGQIGTGLDAVRVAIVESCVSSVFGSAADTPEAFASRQAVATPARGALPAWTQQRVSLQVDGSPSFFSLSACQIGKPDRAFHAMLRQLFWLLVFPSLGEEPIIHFPHG